MPVSITAYTDKTFTYVRMPLLLFTVQAASAMACELFQIFGADMSLMILLMPLQELKTPPTSYFIKKALDLKGGSQKPGHQSAGQLSLKHVLEIATVMIAPTSVNVVLRMPAVWTGMCS